MLGSLYRMVCGTSSFTTDAVLSTSPSDVEIALSNEELFLQAISEGNLEAVQHHLQNLLHSNASEEATTSTELHRLRHCLTMQTSNGWTALQLATASDFPDIVDFLLSLVPEGHETEGGLSQADLINDRGGSDGITSLALAIANNCSDTIIKRLLSIQGVEIAADKCTIGKGRNIVYAICRSGSLSLAETVVANFGQKTFLALAQLKDSNGLNALHAAALMKETETCRFILNQLKDVDLGDDSWTADSSRDGSNALHFACRYQRKSYLPNTFTVADRVKAFVEVDKKMGTTVQVLLAHFSTSASLLQTVLTAADVFGSTPVHIACLHGNHFALSIMLKAVNAQMDTKKWFCSLQDNDGHHPTHSAAQHMSMLANQMMQQPSSKQSSQEEKESEVKRWLWQQEMNDTKTCLLMLLLPSNDSEDANCAPYPLSAVDYCDYTVLHLLCSNSQSMEILAVLKDDLLPGLLQEYGKEVLSHLLAEVEAGSSQLTCLQQCFKFLSQASKDDVKSIVDSNREIDEVGKAVDELHRVAPMLTVLVSYLTASSQAPALQLLDKAAVSIADPNKKDRYKYRCGAHNRIPLTVRQSLLDDDYSTRGVARYLQDIVTKENRKPKVVFLLGAGVSTAAGIPDFRSSTGLYSSDRTRNMFSTEEVITRPSSFYRRVQQMFLPVVDRRIKPTATHAMLRLLQEQGWLSRIYTQNIDLLEYHALEAKLSGVESVDEDRQKIAEDAVVECHGSFKRAYCTNPNCSYRVSNTKQAMEVEFWSVIRSIDQTMEEKSDEEELAGVYPRCKECQSVLRPDVTFFGEPLPLRFFSYSNEDIPKCDLMIIAGTTLLVYPVASLPSFVNPHCVRLMVNREAAGPFRDVPPGNVPPEKAESNCGKDTLRQWETSMYRDVFHQGDCDEGMAELARELGLEARLAAITKDLQHQ